MQRKHIVRGLSIAVLLLLNVTAAQEESTTVTTTASTTVTVTTNTTDDSSAKKTESSISPTTMPTTTTSTSSPAQTSTGTTSTTSEPTTTPVNTTDQTTEIPNASSETSTVSTTAPSTSPVSTSTTSSVTTSLPTTSSITDLSTTSISKTSAPETIPTTISTMTSSVSLTSTPSKTVQTSSGTTLNPSSTSTVTSDLTQPSTTVTQKGSTNTDSNSSAETVTPPSTLTTVTDKRTTSTTTAATTTPTTTQTSTGTTTSTVSTTSKATTRAASSSTSTQTTTVNETVESTSPTTSTTSVATTATAVSTTTSTQTAIGNETTGKTTSTISTTPEATTTIASTPSSIQTTTDTDNCQGNPCQNGGNCTDGVNDYTCSCAAGYDGKNCSNDKDDCKGNPCQNGGNCTDGVNDYTCTCAAGYDGKNCSNDIDDCKGNPCQNGGNCTDGVNDYKCTCAAGYDGKNCSNDIDECEGVTCMHNGTCKDGVNNFTCICVAGWEGEKCEKDVDECNIKTHECHRNADCTNTEGSYNCACKQGFTGDGRNCNDINECSTDDMCENGATCFNTPGNYTCYCTDYWTGQHCESDIDECSVEPAVCTEDANCSNTNGGYNCSCMSGYRGNGHEQCLRETLIQITGSNPLDGDDNIVGPVQIGNAIYYYGKPYNTFYVSMNGYITLGNALNQRYPPKSPADWTRFKYPVIAPLWSDIETQGQNSNLNYIVTKSEEHLELIGKAMNTNKPSLSIIVTWKKAVPYPFNQNSKNETADFQAVISTVGPDTYLMFNYDQEFFTWKTGSDRIVAVGHSMDNFSGNVIFDKESFTNVIKNGTDNVNGRWVFNVTSSESKWEKESACLATVLNGDLKSKVDNARSDIEHCPCTLSQVKRDRRFKINNDYANERHYISRFKRGSESARQKCHYSSVGSLLKGYPGGGYIDVDTADQAFSSCCLHSDNCAIFFSINPSDTCAEYIPPTWSPSWGDPHITTLDGANYTFNARGEFILLQLKDQPNTSVEVQVRTELARPPNVDATVFVGLALKAGNGEKVELLLNRTSETCDIYVNGILNATTGHSSPVNVSLDEMHLFSNGTDHKTIIIAVSSGLNLIIKISNILDIVASAPNEGDYKGNTLGLLGNNDVDKTDDYRPRNDTDQPWPSNSSEKDLFFNFGLTWRVRENESLFTYNISGSTYQFYNNQSIMPNRFISDLSHDEKMAYVNKSCTNKNVNLSMCEENQACLVDAVAMCDLTFGERSRTTEIDAENEKKILDHKPPVFLQPNPLYVGFGENSTEFSFNFSVEINTTLPTDAYFENETYFSWMNVSAYLRSTSVYLKIIGTDNLNATSEYWPDIYYCGCSNKSECDYSLIIQDGPVDGSEGKFFRARCSCSEGMTGEFCDKAIDRCANNECFEGVSCNSSILPPDNPCGPCPPGLKSNGSKCYDLNECYEGLSLCEQICINTNGSYKCDCEAGYKLASDGTTCTDIDECEENPNRCNDTQYCKNTDGSYECLCRPGYSYFESENECKRETAAYSGILVLKTAVKDETKLKKLIKDDLENLYKSSGVIVTFVEVFINKEVDITSRRRRSTNDYIYMNALFVLHTDKSYSTAEVYGVLSQKLGNAITSDDGYGQLSNPLILLSVNESKIYSDEQGGICAIPEKTDCDTLSTTCTSANGTHKCKCRTPEFEGWENPYTSCKDVDECEKSVCDGGECVNYAGGYICNCPAGHIYENNSTCTDMCTSSPCQNDGQCIHGDVPGLYLCKCDDKWTGPNCESKNEEAEKMKITAIAVGASVGAVCLLLLLALFGMYRRQKHKHSGYRRPLSTDFDSAFGITMPTVGTKDFPIDDDTDTAFSIPRPNVNRSNGYDHLAEREMPDYRRLETGDSGRLEQPKEPLTKRTTESKEDDGIDNSSFLHSSSMEEARRSSKRISKNPYEYF